MNGNAWNSDPVAGSAPPEGLGATVHVMGEVLNFPAGTPFSVVPEAAISRRISKFYVVLNNAEIDQRSAPAVLSNGDVIVIRKDDTVAD